MVGEEEGILSCLVGEKDSTLRQVFISISTSISEISRAIRTTSTDAVGSSNTFGDTQLVADLMAESVIRARLEQCEYVGVISSEEHPEETVVSDAPEAVFSVAFDPLDGSSIIGSNFSVGSIFGVWKHRGFLGQSGRDMVGAAYAVYGPRTVMVCAYQIGGEDTCVDEYTLFDDSQGWKLTKKNIRLEERKKLFAPANLRASKDNEEYASLMRQWMEQQYTLRYTGGMVPDIHNIITKGGGVFCNPVSASAPAKLRLLYECHPFSYIITAAGGLSIDGQGEAMDRDIDRLDARSSICLGSRQEVLMCTRAMELHLD